MITSCVKPLGGVPTPFIDEEPEPGVAARKGGHCGIGA